MLKNNIKKSISAVIITVLLTALIFSVNTFAANFSVSISSPTVTEGNNVSVTVKSSIAVAGVDIVVQYDAASLEFVSYSGPAPSVSSGSLHIVDYRTSGAAVYSETIVFKPKKVGSSSVKITKCTASSEDGKTVYEAQASGTVTVKARPAASSDATLKSLSVSPGKLSPSFSSSRTEYEVSVANSVTSIAISAKTNHSAAKYSVSGNTKLSVGSNTVKVRVAAENGNTKTYIITVKRAEAAVAPNPDPDNPDPTPTPNPEEPRKITVKTSDNKELTVSDFEDSVIPAGFERSEIAIGEEKVQAITFPDTDGNVAVYLTSDDGAGFYYYNVATGIASAMQTLTGKAFGYTVLNVTENMQPPEGYVREYITVGEISFYGFSPADITASPESYVVYAANSEGKAGFYVYDISEGTFQRYGIVSVKKDETPAVDEEPTTEYPEYAKWIFYGVSGAAAIFLLLFIIFLILYVKTGKSYKKLLAAKRRAAARRREKMLLMKAEEEKAKGAQETISETLPDEIAAGPEENIEEPEQFVFEDKTEEPVREEEISVEESSSETEAADEEDDTDISFIFDDDETSGRKNRKSRENRKGGKDKFDAEMIDLLFPQEDPDDE